MQVDPIRSKGAYVMPNHAPEAQQVTEPLSINIKERKRYENISIGTDGLFLSFFFLAQVCHTCYQVVMKEGKLVKTSEASVEKVECAKGYFLGTKSNHNGKS